MSKRPNNTGSIVQRKDGIWQVSLRLYGRRITRYARSKQEAQEKLKLLLKEVAVHDRLPESHTLSQLLHQFLAVVEPSLKPRTISDYRKMAALALDKLGDIPLSKLTPSQLQATYTSLKDHPHKAMYLHVVLHRALKLAEQWQWLPANPADRVVRPKYRKRERELWTVDELKRFMEGARESSYWPFFVVALSTGMRYGELIALRWTDWNDEQNTLHVNRTLGRIDGKWVEEMPKTRNSRRVILVDGECVNALRRQKTIQAEFRLRLGEKFENTLGRIFTNVQGGPLDGSRPQKVLRRICAKIDIKPIRLHDFRHLHASITLEYGAPLALVSRQLGHANPSITASIYSHAISDGKLVSEALSRALRG